jgi:hypothetical protein
MHFRDISTGNGFIYGVSSSPTTFQDDLIGRILQGCAKNRLPCVRVNGKKCNLNFIHHQLNKPSFLLKSRPTKRQRTQSSSDEESIEDGTPFVQKIRSNIDPKFFYRDEITEDDENHHVNSNHYIDQVRSALTGLYSRLYWRFWQHCSVLSIPLIDNAN